jgi:iron complex transport system substrate-binding protein
MILNLLRINISRLSFSLLFLFGLTSNQPAIAGITLPQADGELLTLTAPATRIITLAPNLAELVFAAGAGKYLKAVVEYSNFPAQVTQIPRVGDAFRIDLESVIEFEPDLVIAWKSGNPPTALQKLQQLGIKVWQLEITRPAEIAEAVDNISRAAGTEHEGATVARKLRSRLARLQQDHSNKTPMNFFYQVADRPLYTVNGQHIISRSLEICAGQNIFSDQPALAPQISRESVILADPQVMFAPGNNGDTTALHGWQEWPRLQAVENNHLFYLPADEISQATPRLLDSIELACKFMDEVRSQSEQVEEK